MTPAMEEFIDANQPVTALQVAQALGITRQSFYEVHKAGKVHITGWTRGSRGHAVALYALGEGRDVPRPRAMPQAQRNKAYMKRHSAMIKARRPSKATLRLGVWAGLLGN